MLVCVYEKDLDNELFVLVGAIDQVVHDYFERDGLIWIGENGFPIVRNKCEVVEECIEVVNKSRSWKFFGIVIDEPASNIVIEAFWDGVEKILHSCWQDS